MNKELYTAPDAQMIVFATADIMQGSGNETGPDVDFPSDITDILNGAIGLDTTL